MSSKIHEAKTRRESYVQKIDLNLSTKKTKRNPKFCPNCEVTTDCINLFSNKLNRIEEVVNNYKNFPKNKTEKISVFNAKFTLNNVPCELEYDLSNFTLENLQKLASFITQNCNNNDISNNNGNSSEKTDN
ncbi:unnamed protein product [Rhizophagus irregularis]|uniref:Uncharacterized protein n=1 Tax=Rhizophagus irregularis TaxID=588596 RepID=A0A2N1MNA9_9GLOM|nr:hypothetical protein RhiirC2_855245 [Rhizophagus irregularis]CAB4390503.1 unnamed protein product [Rhizophagus irregularis]CAB5370726.1 unnamed protein product [Rhizophagus irregularis]